MKVFVMLVCVNPSFLGCDVIFRDYFETMAECQSSLHAVRIKPTDVAACMYDPEHRK